MSHVSSSTWLKIYIQQRETVKQIEVNTNEAKILSFQDANEAIIEVLTNDLVRFQINYYGKNRTRATHFKATTKKLQLLR